MPPPTSRPTRLALLLASTTLLLLSPCLSSPASAEVADKVDWPAFLARHDMVWTRPPDSWGSGAFMGNGLLGANVFATNTAAAAGGPSLHWRIGRSDVVMGNNRIPVGELVLKTAGTLQGGHFRLDLWNAELTGEIQTSQGAIKIRSFTHADQMVQVIELQPTAGEKNCRFEWEPGLAADPRKIYQKTPIPENEKNPDPQFSESAGMHLSTQSLFTGAQHATAWTEVAGQDGSRLVLLSVGFSMVGDARPQALASVNQAVATGLDKLASTHRDWWHQYWPESFLSIPDTRLESFYWLQMYKLASATRADRMPIDLNGPWFNTTPWPKIWWNLNIELTYWPVLTANRLELGEPLCRMLDDGKAALAANARQFAADSYALGRSCGYDLVRAADHEICDLPWALHNYYLLYRYGMDDAKLQRLLPLLKGSMNYYFHHMQEGPDGRLHVTEGYSPEYPGQPAPNPDCNIDLALIRWGCQTLLATCQKLKLNDPLIPKWNEVLEKLVPYPVDGNGLRISAGMAFAESHRHYSHLLMMYPLYIINLEQPENRDLVVKSLNHWMGMPKELRGYSYTGAASISAVLGRGDEAAAWLNKLLDEKILPNTLYTEAGPCIETPLSGAASLHDMLLSSWGGKIRVFPAVPAAWHDVTFHNLRAEGAFLVSAVRKEDKLQFIRIQSLAGEPCRVVTDMPHPSAPGFQLKPLGDRDYELDLKKGQTAILTPGGAAVAGAITPVSPQKARENFYGLH
ncbi:MAG: glycoside hydrolase family 95-like protein [Verrucomicrobiota bacterium]